MAAVLVATPALAQTMDQNESTTENRGTSIQQDRPMNQPVQRPMQQTSSAMTVTEADAFETVTPPLTYSVAEDRQAAVTHLDDAIGLIDWANRQMSTGNLPGARAAIVGASGKLTTAYLLNFRDRDFAASVQPVTLRFETALNTLETDPQAALNELSTIRNQVASAGQAQLALMGGGAGQGTEGGGGGGLATGAAWEELNFITMEAPTPGGGGGMQDLNIPDTDEID
jgi:hypothetical protein